MLFCIVDLPATPARAGKLRRVPLQCIDSINDIRNRVPSYLTRLGLESAPIEQWDMIARDQQVLVKVGTIHADRSIRWRKP